MRLTPRFFSSILFAMLMLASVLQAASAAERHIVVAASGGDYTTIQDALAAINPTVNDPYVIDVMPGKYNLYEVPMKSFVHLRGAGRNVTSIIAPTYPSRTAIIGSDLSDVRISGFRFYTGVIGSPGAMGYGINISNSDKVTIADNTFENLYSGVVVSGGNHTIENNLFISGGYPIEFMGSTAFIRGNELRGTYYWGIKGYGNAMISSNDIHDLGSGSIGIYISGSGNRVMISNNMIRNAGTGIRCYSNCDQVTIQANAITDNVTNGIYIYRASPTLLYNRITGNGGGTGSDILLSQSSFNGSFNVYDTMTGSGVNTGSYNVTSNGSPTP
jgi:hypothetical protein